MYPTGPLWAGDLKNEGSRSFQIEIIEGASTTHSSISGGTTRINICQSCIIRVVETGAETELEPDDTAIITEHGGLKKER